MCRKLINWGPSLVYMLAVFCFSHSRPLLESAAGSWNFSGIDKVAHFFEYLVLYCLLYRSFLNEGYEDSLTKALVGTCLFGVSDEIHQWFLPYRDFQFGDILADWAGAAVGYSVLKTVDARIKNPEVSLIDERQSENNFQVQ